MDVVIFKNPRVKTNTSKIEYSFAQYETTFTDKKTTKQEEEIKGHICYKSWIHTTTPVCADPWTPTALKPISCCCSDIYIQKDNGRLPAQDADNNL